MDLQQQVHHLTEERDALRAQLARLGKIASAEVAEADRVSATLGDDYVTRAGVWAQAARDLDLGLWAARLRADKAEQRIRELEAQLARQQENEGLLFRQLSDLLTAGNAGTWDELVHAASHVHNIVNNSEVQLARQSQAREPLWRDVQRIFDTFQRDEAAGYRSRDRQFVIDLLRPHMPLPVSPSTEGQSQAREPQWQPIETAPKDGTLVLVYYREGGIAVRRFAPPRQGELPRWIDVLGNNAGLPTHWMKLPEPPK